LKPVEFTDTVNDVLRVEVIDGTVMFPLCDGTHKICRDEPEGATFVYDANGQRTPAPGQ
jgi:hypothetical protein